MAWLNRYRVGGRVNFSSSHYTEPLSEIRKSEEKELKAMASVNKVFLIGNLGGDPDLNYTTSGKPFCKFSLATSDKWNDANGLAHEKTEWHRITVWGKQAENCKQYLTKGSQACIDGRLSTNSWDDPKTGEKKYATEIIAESVKFIGRIQGAG